MFTLNLDENNYVLSIAHTPHDDVALDLSEVELEYLNAYHYIGGKLVLDSAKKEEMIAEEVKINVEEEISELKQKLNETDYIFTQEVEEINGLSNPVTFISDFIKILVSYSSKYKDVISNRKAWRERIKELEG